MLTEKEISNQILLARNLYKKFFKDGVFTKTSLKNCDSFAERLEPVHKPIIYITEIITKGFMTIEDFDGSGVADYIITAGFLLSKKEQVFVDHLISIANNEHARAFMIEAFEHNIETDGNSSLAEASLEFLKSFEGE